MYMCACLGVREYEHMLAMVSVAVRGQLWV